MLFWNFKKGATLRYEGNVRVILVDLRQYLAKNWRQQHNLSALNVTLVAKMNFQNHVRFGAI